MAKLLLESSGQVFWEINMIVTECLQILFYDIINKQLNFSFVTKKACYRLLFIHLLSKRIKNQKMYVLFGASYFLT